MVTGYTVRHSNDLAIPARAARPSRISTDLGLTQSVTLGIPYLLARPMVDGLESPLARLHELGDLQPDWDSYGADSLSPRALKSARIFLIFIRNAFNGLLAGPSNAQIQRILPFAIVPSPDGGVQLEWHGSSMDLELEIDPDGKFSYLLIDKQSSGKTFKEESFIPFNRAVGLVYKVLKD